jgi:hypothetical protein
MTRPHRSTKLPLAILAAAAITAVSTTGCAPPSLMHVGYTPSNKVWYHWVDGPDKHTIVVCDVQPDGSETHCVESEI